MEPRFKVGDLVRFKEDKLEVVSDKLMRMSLDVSDALGKVTGSVDMGPEGISYFVDIEFKSIGMTLNVKLKEDQLLTPMEYLNKKILGSFRNHLNTFGSRILGTDNPGSNSWMKDLIEKWEKEHPIDLRVVGPVLMNPDGYHIFVDCGFERAEMPKQKKDAPVHADKMPTQKCVRLLESFVAEREKVKSGRRFERCLRDSVVDEALARAIELLKEKQ